MRTIHNQRDRLPCEHHQVAVAVDVVVGEAEREDELVRNDHIGERSGQDASTLRAVVVRRRLAVREHPHAVVFVRLNLQMITFETKGSDVTLSLRIHVKALSFERM